MRGTSFLMTFLAGLGAGIATGILLSPERRHRIRERVNNLATRSAEAIESGTNALKSRGSDALDDVSKRTTHAADELAERSRGVAHGLGEKLENAGKRLQEV